MGEAISTTECERGKKILEQNMGTERSQHKAEWIKNMETELRMLEEVVPGVYTPRRAQGNT